jgi:hypothetical protein
MLGDLETDLLQARLDSIALDRPVFITGLARCGSTILLDLFARLSQVGTHRYRDFPFLLIPFAWNRFQSYARSSAAPVERPHKDRIIITKESPEAFEEPLWMHFFPKVHDPQAGHLLTRDDDNGRFNSFYRAHLRKILLLRNRRRYVSKGNYNIARLDYIGHLFSDARFVVPIRHPVTHVASLVRQHELFTNYSKTDPRVPEYLRAAGHFEFGPQRVPINIDAQSGSRILEAWVGGREYLGYALLWRAVYSHVRALMESRAELAERIVIVRYEDFASAAQQELRRLFQFCELEDGAEELFAALPHISAPPANAAAEAHGDEVWEHTAALAQTFGYSRP